MSGCELRWPGRSDLLRHLHRGLTALWRSASRLVADSQRVGQHCNGDSYSPDRYISIARLWQYREGLTVEATNLHGALKCGPSTYESARASRMYPSFTPHLMQTVLEADLIGFEDGRKQDERRVVRRRVASNGVKRPKKTKQHRKSRGARRRWSRKAGATRDNLFQIDVSI